jgi:Protein of unknown function (DUF4240)
MNENLFWKIIEKIEFNNVNPLEKAIQELAKYSTQIRDFDAILSHKLYELDGEIFAQAVYGKTETMSVDDFLYVRCYTLAQGKDFYEKIRQNPSLMPNETFEPLLYLSQKSYELAEQKTDYYPILSEYHYETYCNAEAWGRRKSDNFHFQLYMIQNGQKTR